jgi:hypothetical protein
MVGKSSSASGIRRGMLFGDLGNPHDDRNIFKGDRNFANSSIRGPNTKCIGSMPAIPHVTAPYFP